MIPSIRSSMRSKLLTLTEAILVILLYWLHSDAFARYAHDTYFVVG